MYKNFKNVEKSTKSGTITNVQSPTMIVKCRISFPCASKRVDTAYLNPKSRGYRSVTQKYLPEQVYCHDVKTLVALSCDFNILG